jgi:hypothetical protein
MREGVKDGNRETFIVRGNTAAAQKDPRSAKGFSRNLDVRNHGGSLKQNPAARRFGSRNFLLQYLCNSSRRQNRKKKRQTAL